MTAGRGGSSGTLPDFSSEEHLRQKKVTEEKEENGLLVEAARDTKSCGHSCDRGGQDDLLIHKVHRPHPSIGGGGARTEEESAFLLLRTAAAVMFNHGECLAF